MSNEFHDENNLYHFSYRDPNAESHAESAAAAMRTRFSVRQTSRNK